MNDHRVPTDGYELLQALARGKPRPREDTYEPSVTPRAYSTQFNPALLAFDPGPSERELASLEMLRQLGVMQPIRPSTKRTTMPRRPNLSPGTASPRSTGLRAAAAVYPVVDGEKCAGCGTVIYGPADVTGSARPPHLHDLSICGACGNVAAYYLKGGVLYRRPLSAEEEAMAARHPQVVAAQTSIRVRAALEAHPSGKADQ